MRGVPVGVVPSGSVPTLRPLLGLAYMAPTPEKLVFASVGNRVGGKVVNTQSCPPPLVWRLWCSASSETNSLAPSLYYWRTGSRGTRTITCELLAIALPAVSCTLLTVRV